MLGDVEQRDGRACPMGVSHTPLGGINFAVHASDASAVMLRLYRSVEDEDPQAVFVMQRTGDVFHAEVRGAALPLVYDYAVLRADAEEEELQAVLDPLAPCVVNGPCWGETLPAPRCMVPSSLDFDWEGVVPPRHSPDQLFVYEMHVRGFTASPTCPVPRDVAGTYLGVAAMADYLAELGVTAVELLPVFDFDEMDCMQRHPESDEALKQYWGYSPRTFCAPQAGMASHPAQACHEFKVMVRELHRRGIEVYLDVVYNHTGGGSPLHVLARRDYYLLGPDGHHTNYSGCGNTLSGNSPACSQLILHSLRHWVTEYRVDGFRFDEATIFCRDVAGALLEDPPIVRAISHDPVLRHTRLIAEAWDASGTYKVGGFPCGDRWMEWNGCFRDSTRRFIRGDAGSHREFATRIGGSKDLFGARGTPAHSLNFVACHDGFTLRDMVTYSEKHNLDNGEDNRDGIDENLSCNYGTEGPDAALDALRERQVKNLLLALLLARGVPMLHMGDEYGHTRRGNNNPWNQDNELNWVDWSLATRSGVRRFVQRVALMRRELEVIRREGFVWDEDIAWHAPDGSAMDWHAVEGEDDARGTFLAFSYKDTARRVGLYVAFNASEAKRDVVTPAHAHGELWVRAVDTSWAAPYDAVEDEHAFILDDVRYAMEPLSAVVFKALPVE